MAYANNNGVRIYYEDYPSKSGNGPTILLSHGFSLTAEMWAGQIDPFTENYRVITWDMRGHGLSDSPDDQSLYSMAHTVADMAAILDQCDVRKAVIGGLSLGGYMSLAFNLALPERVLALLLFDTGPGFKSAQARAAWNETAEISAARFEASGLDALAGGGYNRLSTHRSAAGLARAARGMLAQQNDSIIQSLPQVKVPTLVLVGENDQPFFGATDYMVLKIPGAVKVVIPGAGHTANIDQPAAFNEAVLHYLSGIKL